MEDPDKLVYVTTVADIEALHEDTEYVFVQRLDDEKVQSLARLKHLKVLYQDSNSHITDAGLKLLGECQSLRELDLEGSGNLTDAGLVHLEKLTQLRWLDLGFCPGTTLQRIRKLKEALPDCEMIP